jgi:hypothetical protein
LKNALFGGKMNVKKRSGRQPAAAPKNGQQYYITTLELFG